MGYVVARRFEEDLPQGGRKIWKIGETFQPGPDHDPPAMLAAGIISVDTSITQTELDLLRPPPEIDDPRQWPWPRLRQAAPNAENRAQAVAELSRSPG